MSRVVFGVDKCKALVLENSRDVCSRRCKVGDHWERVQDLKSQRLRIYEAGPCHQLLVIWLGAAHTVMQ